MALFVAVSRLKYLRPFHTFCSLLAVLSPLVPTEVRDQPEGVRETTDLDPRMPGTLRWLIAFERLRDSFVAAEHALAASAFVDRGPTWTGAPLYGPFAVPAPSRARQRTR